MISLRGILSKLQLLSIQIINHKFSDIVIKINAVGNLDFHKWRRDFSQGKVFRKDGSIVFFDAGLKEISRYNFFRAWPSQYKGITIDRQSPQSVFTEEFVLTVEGIERVIQSGMKRGFGLFSKKPRS